MYESDISTVEGAGKSVSSVISSVTMGNIFVNLIFAASLKYLWKMLDSLQLMVHLPMLSVAYPGNAKFFFKIIIGLLNFKML
jgi:hypothetical protein